MKVYDAASIRNIAIVGHGGSGKTQLTSSILFNSGMVNRLGKVDEGNTVTDFDEEEIARKHTLSASLAFAEWNKAKINLIDTPGFANFFSDARAAMRVADGALVLVDAVSGPEVQTEKAWEACEADSLPRLVVFSRMDRDRASLERTLEIVQATFGRGVVPIQMPIGEDKSFRGVVDLVAMKAYTWAGDGSAKVTEVPVPADMTAKATAARDALIEMVAEADDSLMEKFFEAGTLTQDEFLLGLRTGVQKAKIFPAVCTSGIANVGIQPLLDAVLAYLPAASDRSVKAVDKAGAETTVAIGDSAHPAVFVFKTIADPFAGRINLFRVMQGSIKSDSNIVNLTNDGQERLGRLALMQGKAQTEVPEIKAGDIGAVAKLKDTQTSHTLGDKDTAVRFPAITFPEPVLAYAIEPKTRGDEEKISSSMQRLLEEDPTIRYSRDPQTHELLLSGQGQLHIEVTVAKLKRRFAVEVNLKPPQDPVPRDHQGGDRGPRPAQEADGRPRPVRRLHDPDGAAAVGRGLRVRRRHLRRLDPAAVPAGGRKGHPGDPRARLPGRLPGRRLQGDAAGRQVPRRRLERAVVQDGRPPRVQGRDDALQADDPRADHERRGLRPERLRRRHHGRLQQPPRARVRHGAARQQHGRQGPGADGGNADLRTDADVDHRRTRQLPHGVLALRGSAADAPGEDHRGLEGRQGRGYRGRRRIAAGSGMLLVFVVAVAVEFVNAALGMGWGTILTPVLILYGFPAVEAIPAVLISQAAGSVSASIAHAACRNASFRPGSVELRTAGLVAGLGSVAAVLAALAAVHVPAKALNTYVGVLVSVMGIVILLGGRFRFSWHRITAVALVSAFNKGLSGGGFGPIVTGGQIMAGQEQKKAIATTLLSEVPICLAGFGAYAWSSAMTPSAGMLALTLSVGAVLAAPAGAMATRRLQNSVVRLLVGLLIVVLGAWTLIRTLGLTARSRRPAYAQRPWRDARQGRCACRAISGTRGRPWRGASCPCCRRCGQSGAVSPWNWPGVLGVLVHHPALALVGLAARGRARPRGGSGRQAPCPRPSDALAALSASDFFGSYSLPSSSTSAISAESPRRKPAFMIRMYPPGRSAKRGASVSNSFFSTSLSTISTADGAAGVQRLRAAGLATAALGDRDQLLDVGPQFLGAAARWSRCARAGAARSPGSAASRSDAR